MDNEDTVCRPSNIEESSNVSATKNVEKMKAPYQGMEFDSVEQARDYYEEFGKKEGFRVKIRTSAKSPHSGQVSRVRFCCSCEDNCTHKNDKGKKESSCNFAKSCKGTMTVLYDGMKKKWVVKTFEKSLDHKLLPTKNIVKRKRYTLESNKIVFPTNNVAKGSDPTNCVESGYVAPTKNAEKLISPYEGMEFESVKQARDYYEEFGKQEGFQIKIRTSSKSPRLDQVTRVRFCCSCELRCADKSDNIKEMKDINTKRTCNGAMTIVYKDNKRKWIVSTFVNSQDHKLVPIEDVVQRKTQFLKSNKLDPPMGSEANVSEPSSIEEPGYVTPTRNVEKLRTPYEGMEFDSVQQAREYYEEFGRIEGFQIKIRTSAKSPQSDQVNRVRFCCSCQERFTDKNGMTGKQCNIVKSCKGTMTVLYNDSKRKWVVSTFKNSYHHKSVTLAVNTETSPLTGLRTKLVPHPCENLCSSRTDERESLQMEWKELNKNCEHQKADLDATGDFTSKKNWVLALPSEPINQDQVFDNNPINATYETISASPKEKVHAMPDSSEQFSENLVGRKIKVWYPDNQMFQLGIIDSFDPDVKTHKVICLDSRVKKLILKEEKWEYLEEDIVNGLVKQAIEASDLETSAGRNQNIESGSPELVQSLSPVKTKSKGDTSASGAIASQISMSAEHIFTDRRVFVDGFLVSAPFESLYRRIYKRHGHILPTKWMQGMSNTPTLFWAVNDLLITIEEMLSFSAIHVNEVIWGRWATQIEISENLQFNISWLRRYFIEARAQHEIFQAELAAVNPALQVELEAKRVQIEVQGHKISGLSKQVDKLNLELANAQSELYQMESVYMEALKKADAKVSSMRSNLFSLDKLLS